jgi:hypothetical protein
MRQLRNALDGNSNGKCGYDAVTGSGRSGFPTGLNRSAAHGQTNRRFSTRDLKKTRAILPTDCPRSRTRVPDGQVCVTRSAALSYAVALGPIKVCRP